MSSEKINGRVKKFQLKGQRHEILSLNKIAKEINHPFKLAVSRFKGTVNKKYFKNLMTLSL
jgi:hypothetical protein